MVQFNRGSGKAVKQNQLAKKNV